MNMILRPVYNAAEKVLKPQFKLMSKSSDTVVLLWDKANPVTVKTLLGQTNNTEMYSPHNLLLKNNPNQKKKSIKYSGTLIVLVYFTSLFF